MQRFRLLLAAAVVAVSVLGVAAPSLAAENGPALSEEAECYLKAIEHYDALPEAQKTTAAADQLDADIKACGKAPQPLVPAKNELIWGSIGFLVVLLGLWKWGYPAVKQGMDARTERIRNDLDEAEKARSEAGQVLAEYQAQLQDAKAESGRIIEEARQAADSVKRDLTAKAEADIADMRRAATADIEAAKVQAVADLRNEVAAIAIGAAEQVVERNLDRETNVALIEGYINQVGSKG